MCTDSIKLGRLYVNNRSPVTGASLSFVDELRMTFESTLWFSTVMCCKISYKAEAVKYAQAKQAMKRQRKQAQGRATTLTHMKKNACGATSSYTS